MKTPDPLKFEIVCPTCLGYGQICVDDYLDLNHICSACNGSGVVVELAARLNAALEALGFKIATIVNTGAFTIRIESTSPAVAVGALRRAIEAAR